MGDEQQALDSSFLPAGTDQADKINFDDRGNTFFEWRNDIIDEDSDAARRRRDNALENPGLSLINDGMPAVNDLERRDCRSGYNPYESGVMDRKASSSKQRDLRKLSKWIEAKREAKRSNQK